MTIPALSVLDLIPVRSDQTTADALAASVSLAKVADQAGFRRYWVAEHHNIPAVAATTPPVGIAVIAAATQRIRVGSGGVMLPNHAPLVVAEQFAMLEAAFPGRIDLGLGRAPGTDQVTAWALRNGMGDEAVARFPTYVDQVAAMMSPVGVSVDVNGQRHPLVATPRAASQPDIWLLGSSDYSAQLAADRGLPYVFAHHFSGQGTAEALNLYRTNYQPSTSYPEARTFLTVNVVVAETPELARRLAQPQLHAMVALRTGGLLGLLPLVEEAEAAAPPRAALAATITEPWVIGTPDHAAQRISELAARFDVDEVMIQPIAGELTGVAADRSPSREQTLQLVADALG